MDNIKAATTQGVGDIARYMNQMRADELIRNNLLQDINLEKALGELKEAREFLAHPSGILGNNKTKFGEVAEHIEVAFKNADELILGNPARATFGDLGRTDSVDFLIDGFPVQSKFVQKYKSVEAVIEHLKQYPDFLKNNGSYIIPKDYYNQVVEWLKLSPEELKKLPKEKQGDVARAVVEKIKQFEKDNNVKFADVVKPSQNNYADVQYNPNDIENSPAMDTIDNKEQEINEIDEGQREEFEQMAKASVKEGVKAACIAAAIDGVISFASVLIRKLSVGKKLSELNEDDWKEIFKETGIGAVRGGATGGGIYVLTNCANMSAPLASALVTATIGIVTQANKLAKCEISFDDFMYNILDLSVESAVSGIGAFAGQMLIPVPVLGAIAGSLVSTLALRIINNKLLGGGYYKLVKNAEYETAFSSSYRPLVEAYAFCSMEYQLCEQDIQAYGTIINNTLIKTNNSLNTIERYMDSI